LFRSNDMSLPARRSQLVSKRTKIRIFSRGADLQQPKRHGEDAQKRHQAFLAALGRRKVAIKVAGHLRRAELLADSDKKFFHRGLAPKSTCQRPALSGKPAIREKINTS